METLVDKIDFTLCVKTKFLGELPRNAILIVTKTIHAQIAKSDKRQILSRICYKFQMPERQQISHRICNIWRCQQIAARNLTELIDILCQQIGDRKNLLSESDGRLVAEIEQNY